jgi:RNA polymerase sigma-70 factor, ECF subfamily
MEADPLRVPLLPSAAAAPRTSTNEQRIAGPRGPEEQALARAQAGEIAAFRQLVEGHQSAIYSLALRLLGVREDAQELAQDVFLLLYRHLADIASVAHLRFWLRKTACHRAIDRLRARPRLVSLPLEAAAEQEAPTANDDPIVERHLRRLMAQLPPMPRTVLLLRYQEDLDPPEIARALGLSLNTVKSHLRRSLLLLRGRCSRLHLADTGGAYT